MKKKVSLPITITIALIAAAVAFSLAYIIATNSMNNKLTDLSEKQAMFSTLAEADKFAREKSYFDVDEEILTEELCEAYADAYEGRILFLRAFEYEGSVYESNTDYTVLELADGNVIVVLTEEQASTSPQTPKGPGDELDTQPKTDAETVTQAVTENATEDTKVE